MTRSAAKSIDKAASLREQGRLNEAERLCDAVLRGEPQHFGALHLSGLIKHQLGRSVDGLRLVGDALRAKPGSAEALINHGVILDALKRHEEALVSFDNALAMRADNVILHCNRANTLKSLGRYQEALASCDRALALEPRHVPAHNTRGTVLAALDRYEEALAGFDRLLAFEPERAGSDPLVLNNRGTALTKLKRHHEALTSLNQALAIKPDYADALSNRGAAFSAMGRYDQALADYAQALQLSPHFATAYLNQGNALLALNRLDEALASFTTAIALEPKNPESHFNAGITRLCLGDFREGWKQYEYRWQRKNFGSLPPGCRQPVWRGEEDLNGKTIFLMAEQGIGDVIQFARYVPLVAARGAKVLLGVHRPLAKLMACIPGVSQVIASGGAVPDFDLICPLLTLPLAFGTELATIPANIPYIRPDEEHVAKWRARLPDNGRLRIGLCWAGTKIHPNDHNRSMSFDRFAQLLSVGNLDYVNLKKDVSETEVVQLRERGVIDLGREFADFADTAAVVSMLDLVISVDTSVAHLAGAMGKAVALLVPFSPDFRWLLDRTDSPWYPTMRLFRQSAIGDWNTPLDRLRQELSVVAQRPTRPR
jgi:tetratricopeptide (TPR) repeat protein